MTVLTGAQVVSPAGVLTDGEVEIANGRITSVGPAAGPAPAAAGPASTQDERIDLNGCWLVTLVSLMAQPVDPLCEQLGWIADLTAAGDVLGTHLEGPFLSAVRCGAQRPEHLLMPDPLVLRKLLEAGQGSVRTMTVAPELPGAHALITDLLAAGVIAAVGHSDASYEAAEAFAAGATLATHLFNAMGSFDHRAPARRWPLLMRECSSR
ncbi:MAG: hypothetical protein ABI047_05610 [Jatrophihabitantaceae bacterium]